MTATIPYEDRLAAVIEKFSKIRWGARSRAANDLKVSSSHVSNILNGHVYHPRSLDALDAWADSQGKESYVRRSRASDLVDRRTQRVHELLEELRMPGERVPATVAYQYYRDRLANEGSATTVEEQPVGFWLWVVVAKQIAEFERASDDPNDLVLVGFAAK